MKNLYNSWRLCVMLSFVISLTLGSVTAQVASYGFNPFLGTFVPLTGGTATSLTTTADTGLSTAFPIGFNFVYDGVTYTTVRASSNGLLCFNATGSSTATNNLATTTAAARPALAPLWDDLQCTQGATYQLNGVAPNRTLTVEWLNMEWNWLSTTPVISFQVILYETSNIIDFVYREESTAVNNGSASIGLLGSATTDYLSLENTSTSPTYSTTTSTNNLNVRPVTGQVYRFSPPPPTPPTPFQVAPTVSCSAGTNLDVVGTPDPDVTWYWQSTSTGTDLSAPYAGPYNVTSNGTYYLRAYNTVTMTWSINSSSVTVTDFPLAANPPAPIADANPACNATQINVAAAPGGYEYYWQGTSAGTSNALPATAPYDVTSTGTYYVAAYETASQCWSNSVSVAVTINTVPPAVPTPVQTEYNYCSSTGSMPIDATVATGTLEWFDAATGGNLLGTGSPFETVGTSVLPDPNITGTYTFYVGSTNGCQSARVAVDVVVADVLVAISAVNETCTDYNNGSLSVSTATCGVGPFTYSVDGGAFGSAPTGLTAGTYNVVVMDNGGLLSAPMDVVIGTNETTIPFAPTTSSPLVYACSSDASIMVEAQGTTLLPGSLTTTFAAGNGCTAGNMFNITANTMDIIVESFDINVGAGSSVNIYYVAGGYVGNETNAGAWTLVGNYPLGGTGSQFVDFADFTIPAGQTYGIFVNADLDYTNFPTPTTFTNSDITITTGRGLCTAFTLGNDGRAWNGTVHYSATIPANVEWYDAGSLSSNLLGSGSPFETVGTSVIPTVTNGLYDFYAYANNNGCYSTDSLLVQVTINSVKVDLDSIDASCNNQANGSFTVAGIDCGMPPFSYSVDGGSFGPIPTNLLPGSYEVVVQDMNGDQSAPVTVLVGDALPPSMVYMETIEDDGGQVSWTANGSETQWYVEWGLPGFTPGTGTEIGSADALDTFWIITGVDANTNYDVYVSANCGAGQTVGTWAMVNFTTACGVYGIPFAETFEDDSESRVCWENQQEVGTADWTYNTGSSGGVVNTAYQGTLNARFVSQSGTNSPVTKLISPRFDLSGQDSVALVFAYAQENWVGDQNITKVYVASQTSAWTEIQSYNNNVAAWTLDTLFLADTVYQIAFEGINNWGRANVIDDVQLMPCTLAPGVDGSVDVCRADGTVNLNSVITPGENFGKWSFQNPTFIVNDSIAQIDLLPAGTYEFYYVVETPCAVDTTVAYITVFNASSAGIDGTINVCRNEPFDLLSGLSGNVDLGGTWYDPSNNALASSQLMASNIPGQFNYDYIVSNGVCGPDTANVVVNVSPSCDWLNIAELGLEAIELYPNPTSGMIYISNEGSTEVFSYELTDLNGKVITSAENAINGTDTTPVDLSKLEPGVYLIKVANDNVEHTFRVIKQ